ncbi:phage terminase large subunit [Okeania sp. SIO2B9]|uniref:phage terminase large subunit n=1 Tax=Okeania sp. SIO2B9 TaxID=2607782 RepID=UPI001429DD3B|nr:phage terminase large subunit [Okeania sp. SIO2B9]NES91966.1 phage terminase large subunit [Okeania sp. SIO2B9]
MYSQEYFLTTRSKKLLGLDNISLEDIKAKPQEKIGFKNFIKKAWKIVEPGRDFVDNWHIGAIAEHLEALSRGDIKKLLINVPPGHMKSLLVGVFYPAWDWAEVEPTRRSIFSAYQGNLAIRDSVKCRRIVQSNWYQTMYPHIRLTGDVNLKTRFENSYTGFRMCTSPKGVGTGERADIIAVDDPHKVTEAESEASRESTVSWWKEEMSTRGSTPTSAKFIVIMQRVHHKDVSAWAIDNGYEHLCLPGEFEPSRKCITSVGWEDPRKEEGEPLWKEMFPVEVLQDLKQTLGSYGYAGQIQQSPTPREGGIIKDSFWNYCLVPPKCSFTVWAWDTAFKTSNQNDPSAGVLLGRTKNGYYVLDVFCDRLEYPELKRKIIQLQDRDKANAVIIEDAASGQSLIQELRRTTSLPLIAKKADKDKITRVTAIAPTVESGKVFLPHAKPWVVDFVMECSQFPNGAHDDRLDAFCRALNYASTSEINVKPKTTGQKRRSYNLTQAR